MHIAICGYIASGKSTLAQYLSQKFNGTVVSFGTPVKLHISELFSLDFLIKFYNLPKDTTTYKPRKLYQYYGCMMRNFDPDVFVRYLFNHLPSNNTIIIDDLRRMNEYLECKRHNFIVIKLKVSKEVQEERIKKIYENYQEQLDSLNNEAESEIDIVPADFEVESNEETIPKVLEYLKNIV